MGTSRNIVIGLALVLMLPLKTIAQFRIPSFDVEAKGGIAGLLTDNWDYWMTNYQAGIHFHVNQYVAIGATYYRGTGTIGRDLRDNAFSDEEFNTEELITGLDVRFSTGRSGKLRPYLSLNYSKVEIASDFGGYRQSGKTNAIGASAGLLLKLGNRMYLNLIDATGRNLSEELFWLDGKTHLEFKAGLLYNFGKRK